MVCNKVCLEWLALASLGNVQHLDLVGCGSGVKRFTETFSAVFLLMNISVSQMKELIEESRCFCV